MHPLHDHIAKQLEAQLKTRRVVVWYDHPADFAEFLRELRREPRTTPAPVTVTIRATKTLLAEFTGSMFELRSAIEPHVAGDLPEPIIVYLPGCERDRRGSVLMELEKSGTTWERPLHELAREVLLQKYTLGVVDDLLAPGRNPSYAELANAASATAGAEPPSAIKSLFPEGKDRDSDSLLAAWLVDPARDAAIASKNATGELIKLVRSYLGLQLPQDAELPKLRAITSRYVLVGEFRADLSCAPPSSIEGVPKPSSDKELEAVRNLARRLRASHADAYAELADRIAQEVGLAEARLPAGALGAIDTFRFEERELLRHAGELVADGHWKAGLDLAAQRANSFWLDRDVGRKAQWEAMRRMAELGATATEVRGALSKANGDAAAWLAAYTAKDGWYRLDRAQRRLESWVANLDEDPAERPLGIVRRAYEDTCSAMADGFAKALEKTGWTIPGALHQTRVFPEIVSSRPKPVAFLLVDAMRFEMGVELSERLPSGSEVAVRPAVVALPSITPIGMAALMPGASASFSVVEQGGKLGVRIDDAFLPDLAARKKHAAARVPKLADLTLDELLSLSPSRLAKKIEHAPVVVVRSQEIDHAGEGGFTFQARQVMDTVIDNLARGIRKLAAAGIDQAVVCADHGHLFFASDREESMRTDAPGGATVDLHRRCWVGRGGTTPPGCVRVSAAALGYSSDLDFVFPRGAGVFRAGGDLAFYHGGMSLQELVVPVVTIRTRAARAALIPAEQLHVTGVPAAITNRCVAVTITQGGPQRVIGATSVQVRPLLVAGARPVGTVGMVADGEHDRSGCVTLAPGRPVTVVFQLHDDTVKSVRVVLLDPATDAELHRSAEVPIQLAM